MEKYNDVLVRFELDGKDVTFRSMMLSRLKADCDYFLGYGNRFEGHLWAKNVEDHVACMKALWLSLVDDGVVSWFPYKEILEYEGKMKSVEVLFTFGTAEQFPFELGYVSITAPSVQMAVEEFRRHYPDVNDGLLNCADYYYTVEEVARIKEHGNGPGCHRAIVVSSVDKGIDDVVNDAVARAGESSAGNGKEIREQTM